MQKISPNARNLFVGVCAFIAFTLTGIAIGRWVVPHVMHPASNTDVEQLLKTTADNVNKKSPIAVDSETRLDGADASKQEFRYRYTLINLDADKVRGSDVQRSTWKRLMNTLCTSNDMKIFRDNDITVMYTYFGRDGRQITTLTASPSQCNQ